MRDQVLEAEKTIDHLRNKEKMNKMYEDKYLEKLNQQNTSLQLFRKILTKQINKNAELQEINSKINQKLMFYVKNRKINIDEFDDLKNENIADEKVVNVIQKWLKLKDKKVKKVDFFDPEVMLEGEVDLKKKEEKSDGYIKFGHLEADTGWYIHRPHVLCKSHSTNFDVKVKETNPQGKMILK